MKIKVELYIPKISVTGQIEVGDIKNNELDSKQAAIVEDYVKGYLMKLFKVNYQEIN